MFTPRPTFALPAVRQSYFPGHQRQALEKFKQIARTADFALELRDSRVPIASINPMIAEALPAIPRLVLYTKTDTARTKFSFVSPLHPDGDFRLFNSSERKYAARLLRELRDYALQADPPRPLGLRVLITGMPNVGKSSLINRFRRILLGNNEYRKVARTGNQPGVTRSISTEILVSREPRITVLDTPGLCVPQLGAEQTLRLALAGAIPRGGLDPVVLADYLLYQLNLKYPLGGRYPGRQSNDIHEVLWALANTQRRRPDAAMWSEEAEASMWLDRFAAGKIGRLTLDFAHDVHAALAGEPPP